MATTFRFDEWTLYADIGDLEREGKRQRLQDLPLKVLVELLTRAGELVTREQLIAQLWPKGVVDFETSLNTAISKLRTALGDNADSPRYIETIPRKGYRFIGKLILDSPRAIDAALADPSSSQQSLRPAKVLSLGVVLFAVVVAGLLAIKALTTTDPHEHVRLAVLPFENLSSDPSNAFFADGMHDELLTALANRAPDMDVISRTTMMTYRARPKSAPDLAKELNVTHVLEGSVRREGQDVRVNLQLVEARTDKHVWANSYNRTLDSVMTLQAQLSQEVAEQLAIKLSKQALMLVPSANLQAYDFYLKARLANQTVSQRTSREEIERMKEWLTRAIELDPTFAAAYMLRAQIGIVALVYNHDISEANRREAGADIDSALKLAGPVPAVLQVQSRYANIVEANADKAMSLMNLPQARASKEPSVLLWRAFQLARQGRLEESLTLYEQVAELDPGNRLIFSAWEMELWSARRPAEALRVVQSFNEHGPGRIEYGDLEFSFTGRLDRLRADFDRQRELLDADNKLLAEADVFRFEGRFVELNELIERSNLKATRFGGYRDYQLAGLGSKPAGEMRGWAKLLIGDRGGAARAAKDILSFVDGMPKNSANAIAIRVLVAEANLFAGNNAEAIAEMRAIAALVPARFNGIGRYSAMRAARLGAWAGAQDEAVELLEKLTSGFPGLGPAEIIRDPLYSIPLKNNGRYQALEKKLEAEIAENQKLFQ